MTWTWFSVDWSNIQSFQHCYFCTSTKKSQLTLCLIGWLHLYETLDISPVRPVLSIWTGKNLAKSESKLLLLANLVPVIHIQNISVIWISRSLDLPSFVLLDLIVFLVSSCWVSSVELWLRSVCFGAEGSLGVSPLTFSFSVNNWSAFIQSELQEWNPIQGLQRRRRRS